MGKEFEIERTEKKLGALGELICDITSGLSGAALSAFFKAPIPDPLAAPMIRMGISDMFNRALSHKQEIKMGIGVAYIGAKIHQRNNRGDKLREDHFFGGPGAKAEGPEILETVLSKCKEESREKKIRYIANIFANSIFENDPAEVIHLAINIAERLTYRQMLMLALLGKAESLQFDRVLLNVRTDGKDILSASLNHEGNKLSDDFGLFTNNPSFGDLVPPNFTAIGEICFRLMSLDDMPDHDSDLRDLIIDLETVDKAYRVKFPLSGAR